MRFTNLQVVRLYAAVSVLLFHFGLQATGLAGSGSALALLFTEVGPHGVVLFFVLSGVVLAHSIQSRTPRGFLLSRFLRLYPAYWIAALFALATVCRAQHPSPSWRAVGVGMTLLPAGAGRVIRPLGSLEWTLTYEVVFSLAVAAFVAIGGRRRGLLWGSAAWLAAVLGWFAWRGGASRNLLPFWWEALVALEVAPFLLGVFVYFARDRAVWFRPYLPVAAALLLAASKLPLAGDLPFLALSAGCAGLIWYALVTPGLDGQCDLVLQGDRTYGLYLAHVPLIFVLLHAGRRVGFLPDTDAAVLVLTLAVLLAGLLCGELELRLYRWLTARFASVPAARPAQSAPPARLAA